PALIVLGMMGTRTGRPTEISPTAVSVSGTYPGR
ncbi:hypothetical protein B0I27_1222, partial [Arcticibacter pallidicorallinus]